MANKSIPLKDKQLVVERLSEGMSTRQAIKGTSIKSNSTAAQLAKRQSHAIAQYRQKYLEAIEQLNVLTMPDRARLWGEMARATKYVPVSTVANHDIKSKKDISGALHNARVVNEVPDWTTRERALRYIDGLAEGLMTGKVPQKVQVNLINDSSSFQINN